MGRKEIVDECVPIRGVHISSPVSFFRFREPYGLPCGVRRKNHMMLQDEAGIWNQARPFFKVCCG